MIPSTSLASSKKPSRLLNVISPITSNAIMITFGELDPDTPFSFQLQGEENGIVLLDILVAPLGGARECPGLLEREF